MKRTLLILWIISFTTLVSGNERIILNHGWSARRANEVAADGNTLTSSSFDRSGWMDATVPGTVLTTMLDNGLFKAPEFGLNNELIPDISDIGRDFYTFWFINEFDTPAEAAGKNVWLNFRGINYMADIFLNGKRLNNSTLEGMFLRHSFNITPYLNKEGKNHLAVIVFPPIYPGLPNGGQGGDGMIARNCTMQYTPGWDWIQSVRDRNTGIWDEVSLTLTGNVRIENPYIVTEVPGVRVPSEKRQGDAVVHSTIEVTNVTSEPVQGTLTFTIDGRKASKTISLSANEKKEIRLDDITVKNPKLWWPNGIGDQNLYPASFRFDVNGTVSDETSLNVGIRQITTVKAENGGRLFRVNGQKVYMTGGNYINSDWLLRLSPERYEDEVRFHAEMNVRMIRVWGGALLERPDFYDACDRHGILVFQDLWGSADCNGAWVDPMKKESRARRQEYPDNHRLFLEMAEDQIKMVRNHPSLCFWCGANEWPLAKDIDKALQNEVFPRLDPERLFASFSTDTTFTRTLPGNPMDGPYTIQEPEWFFTYRSNPFNPEAGNVGSPEVESFREFMSEEDMNDVPRRHGISRNEVWKYHKDIGYGEQLNRYGEVNDIETYCRYAQAVNYDQYRSFMEGWASHLWDWYNGILIWKTQNPWPGLRGQMYDWYLDVNASLYGTAKGCEPLHPFYNIITRKVQLLNTTVEDARSLTVKAQIFSREGSELWSFETSAEAPANTVSELFDIPEPENEKGVYFLKLSLIRGESILTDNIYWLTGTPRDYTSLNTLPKTHTDVKAEFTKAGDRINGTITLSSDGISFLNRIKLFDSATGKRILPVHYSDNYITLMPGDTKTINLDIPVHSVKGDIEVKVENWN